MSSSNRKAIAAAVATYSRNSKRLQFLAAECEQIRRHGYTETTHRFDTAKALSVRSEPITVSLQWLGNGAQGRNRTTDTVIFSHVLYQLSYLGAAGRRGRGL